MEMPKVSYIKKRFNYDERLMIYNLLGEVIEKATNNIQSKMDRIEKNLVRYIVDHWNNIATKGINKVLDVNSLGDQSKLYTNKDLDRTMFVLDSRFKNIEKDLKKRLKKDMEEIYSLNLKMFSDKYGSKKINIQKAKFTKADQYIIDNVSRLELTAIGDHYPKNLKPNVSKLIKQGVIEKGLNKAQAGEFLKINLTKKLGGNLAVPPSVKAQGQASINAYFKNLSATNVTVAQNFGQINFMREAGIKSYIWRSVIDNTTSEICLQMNGRIFEVQQAFNQMEKMLEVDSVEQLKEVAPFKRNLNEFNIKEGQGLDNPKVSETLVKAGITMPPVHMACYDSETEVYTENGFIPFSNVVLGEKCLSLNPVDQNLEWVENIGVIKKHYKGDMFYLTNGQHSLDMLVTPDHTMFYYKRVDHGKNGRSLDYYFNSVKEFQHAGSEAKLLLSSNWKGEDVEKIVIDDLVLDMKHFCEFMGYYLSDGSVRNDYISIAQIDKSGYIHERLSKMNFRNVTRTKDKIHVYDRNIGKYCKQFGKCNDKFVPDVIKNLSPKYINIFLNAFILCDGHIAKKTYFKNNEFDGGRVYYTTSKRMADDIGELLIKVGKSCSYTLRKTKGNIHKFNNGHYIINHDIWDIREVNSQYRYAKKQIWVKNYDGYVYDISLPKYHTLLVRRNGRVCWGSNCRSMVEPYF